MNKFFLTTFLLVLTQMTQAQVTGSVLGLEDKQAIQNVKIIASDGQKTLSDFEGKFTLFPV